MSRRADKPTQGNHRRPPAASPASVAGPTVSQAELEMLLRWRQQEALYERLRKDVLARLQAGAAVEPGRLTAEVELSRQQRLTRTELVRLLGEDRVKSLQERAKPTEVRRLRIQEARKDSPNAGR